MTEWYKTILKAIQDEAIPALIARRTDILIKTTIGFCLLAILLPAPLNMQA